MVFGFMDLGRCNAAQHKYNRADGLMDIGKIQANTAWTEQKAIGR